MNVVRGSFTVALTVAVAACNRVSTTTAPVGSAPLGTDLIPDATVPAPAPVGPMVDLLYRTHATVSVSSNVQNPRDYPEHLIDKRSDTAWNSKTGDLRPSIQFSVPPASTVRQIVITAGYDKVNASGDLFTMNHRVKQMTLSRADRVVATFDLDPENRKPQMFTVNEAGGAFTLAVTDTVAGTKKDWREVVISELAVLGHAPASELLVPAMPPVGVGALGRSMRPANDVLAKVVEGAPYETLAALCTRYAKLSQAELAKQKAASPNDIWLGEAKGSCEPVTGVIKKTELAAPFLDAKVIAVTEAATWTDRLVVRTARGWWPTSHTVSVEDFGPGCGMARSFEMTSMTVDEHGVLLVEETKHEGLWLRNPEPSVEAAARNLVACALDAAGAPSCSHALIASEDGDGSWIQDGMSTGNWPVQPPHWDWSRDATVDRTGAIRLGPCKDPKSTEIPCRLANADLMLR